MLEVVILFMICLIKYVIQKNPKKPRRFKSKCVQHDYRYKRIEVNININLMEQSVLQINGGMLNVDMTVKSIIYVKNKMFGILLHVIVKIKNI